MLKYEMFHRSFVVRRMGDITKLTDLANVKQLPTGSILHVVDGLNDLDLSGVTPRLNNPLFSLPPERKLILNVTHQVKGPFKGWVENSIKPLPIGVAKELRQFKTDNMPLLRYVETPVELVESSNTSNVINYNPLFSCRIKGIQKQVQLVNYILSNVFNMIQNTPDKYHFVHFNLDSFQFAKTDFIKSFKKMDRVAIKYPENRQYVLLMHFYNYINSVSNTSFLENLSPSIADKTVICFTKKDKALFYNLGTLKELNGVGNSIFIRLVNQVNMLSLIGSGDTEEANELIVKPASTDVITVDTHSEHNIPGSSTAPSAEEVRKFNKADTETLVAKSIKAIDDATDLTPAQKKSAKINAEKFKQVKLGDQTIEEILAEDEDVELKPTDLSYIDSDNIPDKSMLKITTQTTEQQYRKKLFKKDMAKTFASFNAQGMFLSKVEEIPHRDRLNKLIKYKITFEDAEHKKHLVKFVLPEFDEHGRCLINGGTKVLTKQRVNLPIVKDRANRVILSSNYNKVIVQRNGSQSHSLLPYIDKIIKQSNGKIKIKFGNNKSIQHKLAHDYHVVSSKYVYMDVNKEIQLTFDYDKRFEIIKNKKQVDEFANNEKTYGVFIGYSKTDSYYMMIDGTVNIVSVKDNDVTTSTLIDVMVDTAELNPTSLSEWVELSILNAKIPTIFALCYRYGLTHMLKYLSIDYDIHEINDRVQVKTSDVVIKFADRKLVVHRVPLVGSLLFSGLNYFNLKGTQMEEMDDPNVYYDLIQSKKMSVNYLKGIDSFFDLFVDPITKDVLFQMREPTNFKDLLIRATTLLTTDDSVEPASAHNFRFRSQERQVGMVYKAMARAYTKYKYKAFGASSKFTMDEFEIKREILKDPLLVNESVLNPMEDLKNNLKVSHIGSGGRSDKSFVIDDRQFTKDNIGIMSIITPPTGDAGISSQLSVNSSLTNLRGMTTTKDPKKLNPSEVLSVTSLAIPGIINDDSKRLNFSSLQLSHYVPSENYEVSRVRTGFERVLPHLTKPPFAYHAKDKGKILDINEKLHLIKVEYKKEIDVVKYGEDYSNNSANGFYVVQNIAINPKIKKGSKVKKGDVIVYNTGFFKMDPYSEQLDWMLGMNSNVAFIENSRTVEDSCSISKKLANKSQSQMVYKRELTLTIDTNVHQYVKQGDHVEIADPLVIFDETQSISELAKSTDDEMVDLLSKLNKSTPAAKHAGEILDVKAYYKCELSDMSESLAELVKTISKTQKQQAKFAQNSNADPSLEAPGPLTETDKLGNINLDKTVVVLVFFIKHANDMRSGSKLLFSSSLKTVNSGIEPYPVYTEDGEEVDAEMSMVGVSDRIIMTPKLHGAASKILIDLEKQVLSIYDGI